MQGIKPPPLSYLVLWEGHGSFEFEGLVGHPAIMIGPGSSVIKVGWDVLALRGNFLYKARLVVVKTTHEGPEDFYLCIHRPGELLPCFGPWH